LFNLPTIFGSFALLLLLAAIVSSAKMLCGPAARRRDRALASNPAAERSTMLLFASLALSLAAAGFAVVRHFVP